jgi:predicted cupin superfamily sugar epimerase
MKHSSKKWPTVDVATAGSVFGPREGFAATTSTTTAYLDLSAYVGMYIRVQVVDTIHYLCMVAASGDVIDVDGRAMASGKFADNVPDELGDGERDQWVVPSDRPFLAYRTKTDTGLIRVRRS